MSKTGVYIATANRPVLFNRALESLFQQTVKLDQIAILINGDPKYFSEYEKILGFWGNSLPLKNRFIEGKMSPGSAKDIALNMLTTIYATGLDDDDWFSKNRIKLFLDNNKIQNQKTILFSDHFLVKKSGIKTTNRPNKCSIEDLKEQNYVGNCVFGHTSFLQSVGYRDIPVVDDHDFNIRLGINDAKFFKTSKEPTYYWDQENAQSRVSHSNSLIFKETYNLLADEYESETLESWEKLRYIYIHYDPFLVEISNFFKFNFYLYGLISFIKSIVKYFLNIK